MSIEEIRVLIVSPGGTASRGGMGRITLYLTQEFQRQHPSLRVRVLDSYGPGRAALMPFYFLRCLITLTVLCVFGRPQVVHLNLAAHGSTLRKLLLMRLVQIFGVPTLLHIHASKFVPFCEALSPRFRRLLVRSLSRASSIVVIGEFWRRYLVDTLGVPAVKVSVIYNAVPVPPLRAARASNARCRIVALGLLGPRKGTPELLDALASPVMRELDWEAVIAGNGTVDASRARAAALRLSDRVDIPGWVDGSTVSKLLASADVFTLPSHNEGLPVAVLEAMGAGLPVVTTPVGAIPELVLQGDTGILVPAGSASQLAEALAELVRDSELRARLGQSGRARVEQDFRIETMAERFMSIYGALAAGAGSPSKRLR
jgi:glycosyltransferase involved in cell wall biosynthesis